MQIYSTESAFVAVDQAANVAFCWRYSTYGGICPSDETWSNVQIHKVDKAFLAVDKAANVAF